MPDNKFKDRYKYVNNAKDNSLFSSYELLVAKNLSAYHDFKTAKYLVNERLNANPVQFTNVYDTFTIT
jgi:hypothetical protein